MTHGRPAAIADIYQDPRIPVDAYRPTFVRSLIMAPVGRKEPVAALGAYWAETRQPQPDEIEQLQSIADAAAVALAGLKSSPGASVSERLADDGAPSVARKKPAPDAAFERHPLRAFITRVRNNGLRPNSLEAYAFAALCVLAATLMREGFRASGVRGLAVFSTYYPAVLLAMMVGGRRSGVLAAILGGLAAYYFFMPPLYEFVPLTLSEFVNLTLYGCASALIILIVDWYQRALGQMRHEDARHLTLAREQGHRIRNALVVVQAIVRQSLLDQPDRAREINRRIQAGLAQVDVEDHELNEAGTLRELITAELDAYDLARFKLGGEDGAGLPARSRSIVTLAIHELATNAVKYGALSVPGGRVTVMWEAREGQARIVWTEAGGPTVQPPRRRGYGSLMLQRLVQSAGGAFTVNFAPAGVAAEISFAC